MMALAVFWGALGVIGWVYLGYPLVLWAVATVRRRPVRRASIEPTVSMIICAYNEARDIRRKLEETFALDYPADRLEIIVVSDGSTDGTDDIVREFAPRVRLQRVARRGGKTLAQNAGVAIASGEILLFSDATTVYARQTVRMIMENFADPTVGCVCGDLIYLGEADNPSGEGRALFWNYERQLRLWESQVHSLIGTTGCCCAMRRELYLPLPADTISDFVQPGLVTQRGHRTVIEVRAPAYERAESRSIREELHRRARVITRGLRGAFCLGALLDPLRHPWFAIELWSHRVLRWLAPVFLLVLLGASVPLAARGGVFQAALAVQVVVYGAGLAAYALERLRVRLPGSFIPLYFCLVHLAPLLALTWLLRGEKKVVWDTGR
jgi:hypothetical protein